MPVQQKTLLPLFAVFVVLFVVLIIVARQFMILDLFGKYTYYRANSHDEIEALPEKTLRVIFPTKHLDNFLSNIIESQ